MAGKCKVMMALITATTASWAATAQAEIEVPGWRNVHETPISEMSLREGLISFEGHRRAGLDQIVAAPSKAFAIAVRGRSSGYSNRLSVEWENARGRRLGTTRRSLTLPGGEQRERFNPPAGVARLRVLVLRDRGSSALALDAVHLTVLGVQLLRNPELDLKCAPEPLRNWLVRYEGTTLGRSSSGALRLTATKGLAGIDQFVPPPRKRFAIEVRGRLVSGEAQLVAEYSNRLGSVIRADRRRLVLRDGRQRERFVPARRANVLNLQLIQTVPSGLLELERVSLDGGGRVLQNEQLRPLVCQTRLKANIDGADGSDGDTAWQLVASGAGALLLIGGVVLTVRRRRANRSEPRGRDGA